MAMRRSLGALRLSQRPWTDGALLREVGNAAEQSRGKHLPRSARRVASMPRESLLALQ